MGSVLGKVVLKTHKPRGLKDLLGLRQNVKKNLYSRVEKKMPIEEIPQPTLNALTLPDDQFSRLNELLKNQKAVHIRNRDNIPHTFTLRDGKVIAVKDGDEKEMMVIPESATKEVKEKHKDFKEYLTDRIRADFPDMDAEQVERDADVLNEANEAIKRLIKAGIPVEVAKRIIFSVLTVEEEVKTPEDLAKRMMEVADEVNVSNEIKEVSADDIPTADGPTLPHASGIHYFRPGSE